MILASISQPLAATRATAQSKNQNGDIGTDKNQLSHHQHDLSYPLSHHSAAAKLQSSLHQGLHDDISLHVDLARFLRNEN
jgi:hypothetical protein